MPPSPYDYPAYYELAFSWRAPARDVDVFEECIRRFSKIPVRRVLEVACGPAYHLPELAHRGYRYAGFDVNPHMRAYAAAKAARLGIDADIFEADLREFEVETPADFVFILLGSLYVRSTADLVSHLASAARALRPGGLYFLDWCINFRWRSGGFGEDAWKVKGDGVHIDVRYRADGVVDPAAQLERDVISFDVDDRGAILRLVATEIRRAIFPQEFLMLLTGGNAFEFVGWWNRWDLAKPIGKNANISRPITVIRRK